MQVNAFAQYNADDFKKLHKLGGTWTMKTDKGVLNESWELNNDSLMLGKTYDVIGRDTIPKEIMRLEFKKNDITYNPVVVDENRDKPIIFKLISTANNQYIFENKNHDFPQQIIYDITPGNELLASVNGQTRNGKKEIQYKYARQ
jgi:hypothetical protein